MWGMIWRCNGVPLCDRSRHKSDLVAYAEAIGGNIIFSTWEEVPTV